jgi:excisionase family DNA binding protein
MDPLTVTVKHVCELTGLGPTKVWELIREGRLEVARIDGRTLVKMDSLKRMLLPENSTPSVRANSLKRNRGRQHG